MKLISSTLFITLLVSTFSSYSILAATIHIPGDQPTIQAGIEAAEAGDLVLVSPDTYVENIDFLGKAITVRSVEGARSTIIDGNASGSVVTFDSGETAGSVLDGFVIRNGDSHFILWDSCIQGGGGIFCSGSSPTITNCAISNNIGCLGGGIHCFGGSPVITNCTISWNFATTSGILPDGSMEPGHGGGIFCDDSDATITNCTISRNMATEGYYRGPDGGEVPGRGGGIYCSSSVTITNCILWENSAGSEIYGGSPGVTYSDVQGGWPGEGNIDADPLFLGGFDYHLTIHSPCIDAGADAGVYTDMAGEERPLGAGFDMGMDEYTDPYCLDLDMDGYGDTACGGYDCDDSDPFSFPSAREQPCDGVDQSCDGFGDEADSDSDGYMICEEDCDDTESDTYPDAPDPCDGIDQDCGGADGVPEGEAYGNCQDGMDNDCDSFIDNEDSGCAVILIPGNYATIQEGIDAAVDGNHVQVAPGTYVENIDFLGKAITLRSEARADTTVIDGNQNWSVVTFENGESGDAVLDGFTIKNGSGTVSCSPWSCYTFGGGIYCDHSSPTITNCTISGNSATRSGGGIFCDDSSPTITNCTISGNSAEEYGGGICRNVSFEASITNCAILGNTAARGGGIFFNTSSTTITNCTISGNSAQEYGGGICYDQFSSSTTITNCILWGDSAFVGAEIWAGGYFPSIITIRHSDVQGGEAGLYIDPSCILNWLEGNIDSEPIFVGGGDYHLTAGSPCVDAGTPDTIYNDKCFPPSMGTRVNDMGAYGGPGACGWVEPPFHLELDAYYSPGMLNLNFTLGAQEPATWASSLILTSPTVQLIPLWTVPIPVIDPAIDIPITFPFPSLGWIGISTGLYADFDLLPEAFDFVWVDTAR